MDEDCCLDDDNRLPRFLLPCDTHTHKHRHKTARIMTTSQEGQRKDHGLAQKVVFFLSVFSFCLLDHLWFLVSNHLFLSLGAIVTQILSRPQQLPLCSPPHDFHHHYFWTRVALFIRRWSTTRSCDRTVTHTPTRINAGKTLANSFHLAGHAMWLGLCQTFVLSIDLIALVSHGIWYPVGNIEMGHCANTTLPIINIMYQERLLLWQKVYIYLEKR